MKSLLISLNTTYSGCKPCTFMSSFTHSLQVFLFLPFHLTPATSTFLQADTQSSTLLCAPDAQTTSICHVSPHPPHSIYPIDYKFTLHFLSFSDTPHIHLTIFHSVLSKLCRFSAFIAHVSVPYVNTLWTQALYILPYIWYDAPQAVRIRDNSLNLAQAHLTLALGASSTPPLAPSVSLK